MKKMVITKFNELTDEDLHLFKDSMRKVRNCIPLLPEVDD
jgi:hypothetical protein